jgi:hypothetical protein
MLAPSISRPLTLPKAATSTNSSGSGQSKDIRSIFAFPENGRILTFERDE